MGEVSPALIVHVAETHGLPAAEGTDDAQDLRFRSVIPVNRLWPRHRPLRSRAAPGAVNHARISRSAMRGHQRAPEGVLTERAVQPPLVSEPALPARDVPSSAPPWPVRSVR